MSEKVKLVISEKPSVAQAIAKVLGCDTRCDGYLEGNGYIISWCVGHLIELAQPDSYDAAWKNWSYGTLPIVPDEFIHEVKTETASQYKVLEELLSDGRVETVVNACDAGREGELIFRLVYEKAGCKKPMERLWLSSMEEESIRNGIANLKPGRDYDALFESAKCRQEADWLVGINATRLFTVLYQGKVLKVGRVMTPTLAMLAERENAIRDFKKEAYYVAHILGAGVDAVAEKNREKQVAEGIANACKNMKAKVISISNEEKSIAPPKLYDLTTLQRDANRLFGFTAKQTLEYTQSLYEKKLVTYPRTDSQYLSDDMEETAGNVYAVLVEKLPFAGGVSGNPEFKRVLNSKKVTDHHAIIPTVQLADTDLEAVPDGERKVLYLAAVRLLCATAEKHTYLSTKALIECAGTEFSVNGKTVLNSGWKDFDEAFKKHFGIMKEKEPDGEEEKKLPPLTDGQEFTVEETKVTEHFTQPPKHFTEDSLLAMMEKAGADEMGDDVERKGLGTPATRAEIIEKLVQCGFVKREKKQMLPTGDGMRLISVLPDAIKSPSLTAEWENSLSLVARGEYPAETFLHGIAEMVRNLVEDYRNFDVPEGDKKLFVSGIKQEVLGKCPKCGGEVVKGKFGAYCIEKCGMGFRRVRGQELDDSQIKTLLSGKKVLMKGLKNKEGKTYDAYFVPDGYEEYNYNDKHGYNLKVKLEFPEKKEK